MRNYSIYYLYNYNGKMIRIAKSHKMIAWYVRYSKQLFSTKNDKIWRLVIRYNTDDTYIFQHDMKQRVLR